MRVTNSMLLNQALFDLEGLREKYAKAQAAVNGRALERPSEDPQRVVEAMDLSGAKLRLQRSQRSGQDAREWLSVSENGLSAMIDRLEAARDTAVQAGSPSSFTPQGRETMAQAIDSIRSSLFQAMNVRHRDQYLYAGWKTDTQPFVDDANGGVTYAAASSGAMTRDVAEGLSVAVNIPGSDLLGGGDFMKVLSDMAADLRAGRTDVVITTRMQELDSGLNQLIGLRSALGIRQEQVAQYETYADATLFQIEDRLGQITGANLETAVLKMTEAQSAYQAAIASFSKALPTSLLDYMLR